MMCSQRLTDVNSSEPVPMHPSNPASSSFIMRRRHKIIQGDTNGGLPRRMSQPRPLLSEDIPVLKTPSELREAEDLKIFQINFSSNGPSGTIPRNSRSKQWGPQDSTWSYARKPSIAAATIFGTVTFFALVFLIVWYIKRERSRRLRRIRNESQDLFCHSNLTLTEDTSKTLDDCLMKDVQPERTSLMFSRSRSPSFTFAVNEADSQNLRNGPYRGGYEASSNSLSKLNSLTRVSTEVSRPSLIISDLTQTTSNTSPQQAVSSSRLSMTSTVPPTARSSMLWTTTTSSTNNTTSTGTTEPSFVFIRQPTSSSGSILRSNPSNASRTSKRHSVISPRNSMAISIEQNAASRRAQVKSHRRSPTSVQSPIDLSAGASGQSSQLPSIPSTPSAFFQLSDG